MALFEDNEIYQPYEIRVNFTKCVITIEYDPKLLSKWGYQSALSDIAESIDSYIRGSAELQGVEINEGG